MYCEKCGLELGSNATTCGRCGHVIAAPTTALEPEPAKLSTPGIGLRAVNWFVDLAAIVVIFLISSVPIAIVLALMETDDRTDVVVAQNIFLLEYVGYYVVLEYRYGRTLGKRLSRTKVVRLDGRKPRFWQIVGRSLGRLIPLEQLSILFSFKGSCWHDSFSRTRVVKLAPKPPA